ncbi:unnamed protein product [Prunus armeniaca]
MSDSESGFESEPNAYEGESSDGLFDSNSGAVGPDAEGGEDSDVEIIGEAPSSVLTHGIGKGFMTTQPVPLTVVYHDSSHVWMGDTWVPDDQSGASIFGRGEGTSDPLFRPRVTIVNRGGSRVPMGVPKEHLFGVDYLEPNKMIERELAKIRAEYLIPDSVRMRIPGPTESLNKPDNGEVVFFPHVLLQEVRLPLQPFVQRILAQIGYALSQYNPNFWVALMGVVMAFGMASEGVPSYEQFSYIYSITKSKTNDHGGWVQANCLKASEWGYFVSAVSTSQKTWRNKRVLLSCDWESPSGQPVRFPIPTTFQIAGKLKQPSPTQSEIRQIERVRLKVPAVERIYSQFLFTANLIRAKLVDLAEMTDERKAAEVKRMNESSRRHLQMGLQAKKKTWQSGSAAVPEARVDPENQTLAERLRQLNGDSGRTRAAEANLPPSRDTEASASKTASKRPFTVDLDADPVLKRGRQSEALLNGAVGDRGFTEEDPSGGGWALLPTPGLGKYISHYMVTVLATMDMWLCMKRAITVAERAKKAYEDGRAKVAEAGKALQDHDHLLQDKQAAERQVKASEAKLAEMCVALESAVTVARDAEAAKEAVQMAIEESE